VKYVCVSKKLNLCRSSSAADVLDFHVLLRSEASELPRRLGSKIEAKIGTFDAPLRKLGDGELECLSGFYQFGLGPNL